MISRKDIDLYLVDITVHLDILGYSIVLPIMASLNESLGGDVDDLSLLFSSYAVTQFISYLYMGQLSDRIGRKPLIVLSLLGSSLGAVAQGLSRSITALIVFRCITGLFAGSWIVAQAYIADCTTTEERPKYLARLEAFLAAAYIFGPALGGFLGQITYGTPFIAAGIIAGIALIFVCFCLNESLDTKAVQKKSNPKKEKKPRQCRRMFPIVVVILVDTINAKILCMIVEFCNRWQINGWDSYFNSYAQETFGLKELHFSFLVTGLGILSCVLNVLVIPFLIFNLNMPIPYISLMAGFFQCISVVSNLIMGLSKSLPGAMFGSFLMEIGYSLSTSAPSSIISSYSDASVQGEVLSYNMMAGQIAMICAPLAMAQLSKHKLNTPFLVSGCFGLIVVICMFWISRTPGGKMLGRTSREELENSKSQSNSNSDIELASAKEWIVC
ncbi:transporter, major facilitor subfamily protein [Blastocystis sp. subtype 4]|uniref:transporter, major facilitor subfamily protein n=1 Tax=Blastocystis sp. subtype 4 TaxID=944170 RepID=UPI000711D745|nr:transporter, major facilitor subfamily protein [Blastocystis sp. subtype 4]KNB46421.1 transporter, major facilitor subfamily protein [Blastocystis sp. subtype 4]|eukprot:XP_014529864.1 transporter, major facilitor subfamily protein [Blastocystis sp. subtype 4]